MVTDASFKETETNPPNTIKKVTAAGVCSELQALMWSEANPRSPTGGCVLADAVKCLVRLVSSELKSADAESSTALKLACEAYSRHEQPDVTTEVEKALKKSPSTLLNQAIL